MKLKTRTSRLLVAFVSIMLFVSRVPVSGGEVSVPPNYKEVLDNGAIVVANYMPGSSLVTVQLRVLSGLSSEGKYAGTGISHFIEHMIFRGVAEDGGPVRKTVKKLGGTINGSTGQDSAEYHITVPAENLRPAMELIVGMVMAPVFADHDIELERDVILKEMNMVNDDPGRRRIRLLFERAYRRHVYRQPIIGHRELFLSLGKKDLERYHSSVYTPERMVLGVAGGVVPAKVFEYAREVLGSYERSMVWEPSIAEEPRQLTPKKEIFGMDVDLGYLAMGFHTTDIYSPDIYPGNVTSFILGSGMDSFLYRRLVREEQLLHSVSAFNITPEYPGLFLVTGTGEPEKLDEAREVIFRVIDEIKTSGVEQRDLDRARNSVTSSYLRSHETTRSVVSSMTSSALFTGDPSFIESYLEGIRNVVKEDIGDFCEKYLNKSNSTTIYIVPEDHYREVTRIEEVETLKEIRPEDSIREKTLDNGLRLVAKRKGSLPLVSVTFASSGGLLAERAGNNGISNLTASLLLKGTEKRDERDIIPVIERMGGVISAFSGLNSIGMSMDLMSDDLEGGLEIFHDVLTGAVFPEQELDNERRKVIAAIREQDKDIFSSGIREVRRLLYGDHPYSMRPIGEVDAVEALTREDIMDFYRRKISPDGSVIAVAGDIDPGEVIGLFSEMFSSWEGRAMPEEEKVFRYADSGAVSDLSMRREQSLVAIGFPGVSIFEDEKYTLDVISVLLSGRDGILFDIIRDDEGLAYTSGAANVPQPMGGYFITYAATTAEKLERARDLIFRAINKVASGDFTDEDLEASRKRAVADHARSVEGTHPVSMSMALGELYGLGAFHHEKYPEAVDKVSREDVVRAAGAFLDSEMAVVVSVRSDFSISEI